MALRMNRGVRRTNDGRRAAFAHPAAVWPAAVAGVGVVGALWRLHRCYLGSPNRRGNSFLGGLFVCGQLAFLEI